MTQQRATTQKVFKTMTLLKAAAGLFLLPLALLSAPQAYANNLTGANISGTIVPNPLATTVTTQFAPSAVVGSGVEFTGSVTTAAFNFDFNISADFSANDLAIVFTSPNPASNLYGGQELFQLQFTDLPASFTNYNAYTYGCDSTLGTACSVSTNGLYTYTFSPGSLTIGFINIFSGDTYVFQSPLSSPAVPEPSTFALLGTGMLGVAGSLRRRLTSRL